MAKANSIGARNVENLLHGYSDLAGLEKTPPLVITHGKGITVSDETGKEYIEGAAGMWCANFGFHEQELIDAAVKQLNQMPYYHALIDKTTEPAGRLAETLKAVAPVPMARVFFANSGSEANDTMVKIIWYYNNALGRPEKKKIITRHMGFHGVTVAAASLTGIPTMHRDFDLPLPGFLKTDCPHFYRYGEPGETEEDFATRLANNLEALIQSEGPETVAAFVAEPVIGGGGCLVPPKTYFEKIQAVLDRHDILMIADEVITGFGRTGNMFGSQTFNIRPDAMTIAKGLSSSYQPISGVMLNQKIYDVLVDESKKIGMFAHAFTTSCHPVAVAVAQRCQELIAERDIVGHVKKVGAHLLNHLNSYADHPLVGNIRHAGLMAGLELVADKETRRSFAPEHKVKEYLRIASQENGLIIRSALAGDSMAFSPPLIITESEIDEMFVRFDKALADTTDWIARNNLQQDIAA